MYDASINAGKKVIDIKMFQMYDLDSLMIW